MHLNNKENKTSWSSDGTKYPIIEPHTKEKHLILESYLKDWIVTLCANHPGNSSVLTIIDGFCGGGFYKDPESEQIWEGSPVRILRVIDSALQEVREKRSKPRFNLRIKVLFIDNEVQHTECLKNFLNGLEDNYKFVKFNYEVITTEFSNILDKCLEEVKRRGGSSFFFIDPFGYTQFSMSDIRKIMSLNKSEILLTFMIDFIRRFLTSRAESLKGFDNRLDAEGYFLKANIDGLDTLAQQSYLRDETLRLFRDKGNVKYVYTFGMLKSSTIVTYYLIHFANHRRAQEVIKDTLWRYNNIDLSYQFAYGIYGLGFRTPEYFEETLRLFDIKSENHKQCVTDLQNGIIPLIHGHKDGIKFRDLVDSTIQMNPANLDIYRDSIVKSREEMELKVKRNGKESRARHLKPDDIIIKSNDRQYFFFSNMEQFYRK